MIDWRSARPPAAALSPSVAAAGISNDEESPALSHGYVTSTDPLLATVVDSPCAVSSKIHGDKARAAGFSELVDAGRKWSGPLRTTKRTTPSRSAAQERKRQYVPSED